MPLSSVLGAQSLVRPGVCTSSTRPASPFEGQVIYETDTDLVQVYNGSGWKILGNLTASQTGSVLQVQSTTKTDAFTTASTSFVDVTGMSVTITPKNTSSKILVFANFSFGNSTSNSCLFNLVRGSTSIAQVGNSSHTAQFLAGNDNNGGYSGAFHFLDTPSSSSSLTYKIQARTFGGTLYFGRIAVADERAISTITVMEIAG
jgi:hypothetical protein